MSSFLTPDGKTFFGGTYYPRDQFMNLLQRVVKAWNEDQPGMLAQADRIAGQVRAYLQAFNLTGQQEFQRVARQTMEYVLRDLRSAGGGFYSATDADSEGQEGRFFLWTQEQVRAELPQPDADLAIGLFNINEAGNFEGSNIPHLSAPVSDQAPAGEATEKFLNRVDRIRSRLYTAREQRIHPGRDEKIVTAWNAMMIMALAEAAALPGSEVYAKAALSCGDYLWGNNRDSAGQLWRASLNGRSSVPAVQEDYAWLADAFIR